MKKRRLENKHNRIKHSSMQLKIQAWVEAEVKLAKQVPQPDEGGAADPSQSCKCDEGGAADAAGGGAAPADAAAGGAQPEL